MARVELVVALIVLVLEIYSIINCILTPESEVRGIPKALWLILIVLLPLLGSVLWLGVGRDREAVARRRPQPDAGGAPRSTGYSALSSDERIRQMEEDLRRLERESGDDGAETT